MEWMLLAYSREFYPTEDTPMKNQKGFTLIELLLVLAIIGIISAIAIPALLSQRARARDKATVTNMTGTMGDLIGSYDRASENGGVVVDSMTAVLTAANAAGARNPWVPTAAAYTASLVSASALGQVGFVFTAPTTTAPGVISGNAVVKNALAGATSVTNGYNVTKVSNLE
jgi:prepilin-type N-terminal cleavage/methylation domain-containing protein